MRRLRLLTRLALADLWAERVMALCLIVGVAAVLTPLLLLMALKGGFIDRMRAELIADPAFRELRPGDAGLKDDSFLTAMGQVPGVEFAVLTTMMVPREVIWRKAGTTERFEARLLPSGPGDPLLERTGAGAPGAGQAVMSAGLAEGAGLVPGDEFEIMVFRTMAEGREQVTAPLVLTGLLPDEQTPTPVILADAALDAAVESWRAGLPVPALGWAGASVPMATAYPSLLLATDTELTAFELRDVEVRMGAAPPVALTEAEYRAAIGLQDVALPASARLSRVQLYRIDRTGGVFGPSDLAALPQVLDGRRVQVSGLTPPIPAGQALILPVDFSLLAYACGDHCLPGDADLSSLDAFVLQSAAEGPPVALPTGPALAQEAAQIALPADLMLADWRLGGILTAAAAQSLAYDLQSRRFVEAETGKRGFRVIARDLDLVVPVAEAIRAAGHTVVSREDDVLRLQRLDGVLNLLVGLVASVALTGGLAVLGINSFASVQRKITDYAVLRLLGMARQATFLLPMVQAVAVAVLGSALSVALYLGLAAYLNGPVAVGLGAGGKLAALGPGALALTCGGMVAGSLLACIASAIHATRADPAAALKAGI